MQETADLGGAAVLGGPLSPVGWSVGFIEAPRTNVIDELLNWRRSLGADLQVDDRLPAWPACLRALDPLESPWTTELLVAHGDWTAYLNNSRDGGDPWPATSVLSKRLRARWVVATHQPPTPVGHASTQFELGGPDGQPPLRFVRAIAAHAEDGKWSWYSDGPVLPFERPDAYRARRVRDRFTRPLLVEYLHAVGITVDDAARFGAATLVRQRVTWATRRESIEQAGRWWAEA